MKMTKYIIASLFLCFSLVSIGAFAQDNQAGSLPSEPDTRPAHIKDAEKMAPTSMAFDTKEFDFGEIKQGDVVTHTFTFTNTGENPLKLTKVKPSCGCTASDYTKEEVAPGEQGTIKVSFNSAHKRGNQKKSVSIYGNTNPIMSVVYFKGNVIVPKPEEKPVENHNHDHDHGDHDHNHDGN